MKTAMAIIVIGVICFIVIAMSDKRTITPPVNTVDCVIRTLKQTNCVVCVSRINLAISCKWENE